MKRSMMQAYVRGSAEAVARYQEAFGAVMGDNWPNEDGSYYHCELDIEGEMLAVAEAPAGVKPATGDTMQFCLHYGEGGEEKVTRAYETLREGGTVLVPLGPCDFSPLMADLIDAFGVRWCLFV